MTYAEIDQEYKETLILNVSVTPETKSTTTGEFYLDLAGETHGNCKVSLA